MIRHPALDFVKDKITDQNYTEVCYFITDLCNLIPDVEIIVVDLNDVIRLTLPKHLATISIFLLNGAINSLQIDSMMSASYGYFITENDNIKIQTDSASLKQMIEVICEHLKSYHMVDMFVLRRKLIPLLYEMDYVIQ